MVYSRLAKKYMRRKKNGTLLRRGDPVKTTGFRLKGTYQGKGPKGYRVKVTSRGKTINVYTKSRPRKIKNK